MRTPSRALLAITVAALAGAAGTTGCVDFAGPAQVPTRLYALLSVADSTPTTARLTGGFSAAEAPAEPDSLEAWGRLFAPRRSGGGLSYEGEWTPDASDLGQASVSLRGPAASAGAPRPGVSVPFLWRAGPDSVLVGSGEDLQLPLRGVPASSSQIEGLRRAQWQLAVRPAGATDPGAAVTLSASGLPPDTVTLQGAALPRSPGPLVASLSVDIDVRRDDSALAYPVFAYLRLRMRWVVSTDAAAGASVP